MRAQRLFYLSLAIIAGLHLVYGLQRLTLGIDFTDEGAYLAWPLRTLFGEPPFSAELGTLLRPLTVYLYPIFKLHPSITLYEFRLLGWGLHLLSFCALSTYLFRLTRAPLLSPLVASVPFYVCHIFGLASPNYNSMAGDFLLLALCLRGLAPTDGTGRPGALNVASGFALFFATMAHPALGLVGTVVVLHELFWCGLAKNLLRRQLTSTNIGVLVFIGCWAVFVVYLVVIGAVATWYHRITLFQSISVPSIHTNATRFYLRLFTVPFVFNPFNLYLTWAAVLLAAVMGFSARHPRRAAFASASLALLLLFSLVYGFSYVAKDLPLSFVQAALILGVISAVRLTRTQFPAVTPARFLLVLSILGAVVFATFTYFFSPFRSWMSGLLGLPFAFAVGLAVLLQAEPGRFTRLYRLLAGALLLLTIACVAREHYRSIYRDARPAELTAQFRAPKLKHIRSTPERVQAVDALYHYLHPRIQRGEPLLVYDNCPMLYYLFDAMPAYGMTFAVRFTQSPAALEQLNREFLAKPLPRYAVRLVASASEPIWETAARINYDHYPLNETVLARYELERTIFPFEVWRLKTASP